MIDKFVAQNPDVIIVLQTMNSLPANGDATVLHNLGINKNATFIRAEETP